MGLQKRGDTRERSREFCGYPLGSTDVSSWTLSRTTMKYLTEQLQVNIKKQVSLDFLVGNTTIVFLSRLEKSSHLGQSFPTFRELYSSLCRKERERERE